MKIGDTVLFKNCVCGEAALTDGNIYTVINVKAPLFMILDDEGVKRIRSTHSNCFKKVGK